jgi:hypothetical protein
MRALITLRCQRCHRVAAKYWEHDTGGGWITPDDYEHGPKKHYDDEIAELLDGGFPNMIAARVCRCYPPPSLPNGAELAGLLERARAAPHPGRPGRRERWTPLTIRR